MGGTDQMDSNVEKYRISVCGKKRWWCLFTWLIDVSINNAWILMKTCGSSIAQFDFLREIVQTYLRTHHSIPKGAGKPMSRKSGSRVLKSIPHPITGSITLLFLCHSTRGDGVQQKTVNQSGRLMCSKCDVGLCVACFLPNHTSK